MSYTEIINYQETCNYINPEKDNAISMLKSCINDPNYKPEKENEPSDIADYSYGNQYPVSNLKDNKIYAINQSDHNKKMHDDMIQYLSTNNNKYITELNNDNTINFDNYWTGDLHGDLHGDKNKVVFTESKPNFPSFVPPTKILLKEKKAILKDEENIKKNIDQNIDQNIEGFVSGDFFSDNGPGEQYIDVCPDEYELENGTCVKKCDGCDTKYDNSDYTDVCYPYNYDGIDNFGRIVCSSTHEINNTKVNVSTQLSNINSKEEMFSHHDRKTINNANNYYNNI